ncbi:hypothetical protein CHARACLAT_032070 [Characodon lateralis]|uniref:Uncharacterized protein n=1 Tax=Characodon lateralis TaxID=208331 RepID=A0ABU7E591_9TELE|nr:hypothetical protein [Characodon lateralis]
MGQTKSSSRHLHEDHKIEARDVTLYGGPGVPPWSQAWGRDSSESAWWLGFSSWHPAGPSPNERCEAIPQWAHHLQGNHEGPVQRGLGSGRRWRSWQHNLRIFRLALGTWNVISLAG